MLVNPNASVAAVAAAVNGVVNARSSSLNSTGSSSSSSTSNPSSILHQDSVIGESQQQRRLSAAGLNSVNAAAMAAVAVAAATNPNMPLLQVTTATGSALSTSTVGYVNSVNGISPNELGSARMVASPGSALTPSPSSVTISPVNLAANLTVAGNFTTTTSNGNGNGNIAIPISITQQQHQQQQQAQQAQHAQQQQMMIPEMDPHSLQQQQNSIMNALTSQISATVAGGNNSKDRSDSISSHTSNDSHESHKTIATVRSSSPLSSASPILAHIPASVNTNLKFNHLYQTTSSGGGATTIPGGSDNVRHSSYHRQQHQQQQQFQQATNEFNSLMNMVQNSGGAAHSAGSANVPPPIPYGSTSNVDVLHDDVFRSAVIAAGKVDGTIPAGVQFPGSSSLSNSHSNSQSQLKLGTEENNDVADPVTKEEEEEREMMRRAKRMELLKMYGMETGEKRQRVQRPVGAGAGAGADMGAPRAPI